MKKQSLVFLLVMVITVCALGTNTYASVGGNNLSYGIEKGIPVIQTGGKVVSEDLMNKFIAIKDIDTGLNLTYPSNWEYGSAIIIGNDGSKNGFLASRSITLFSPNGYKLRFIRLTPTQSKDWILVISNNKNQTAPGTGSIWYLSDKVKPTLISGIGWYDSWRDKEITEAETIVKSIAFIPSNPPLILPKTATTK